jgi:hypothetical protein
VNDHLVIEYGETVVLSVSFENTAGVPANPTDIDIAQRTPAGTETIAYDDSDMTNPETGTWQIALTPNIEGLWRWEVRGTGNSVTHREKFAVEVQRRRITSV